MTSPLQGVHPEGKARDGCELLANKIFQNRFTANSTNEHELLKNSAREDYV